MWDLIDGGSLTEAVLWRASVILAVEILLFGTSLLNIIVIRSTTELYDVIGCYLISLSVADLLASLCIVPFSLYSTLDRNYRMMGDNSLFCKGTSYLQIALFCSTVYTFAWICIDRYSAMMKPSRYADQSLTRCKCWIVFSWITSLLLCSPIVVAQMQVVFLDDVQLCVLDWSATSAYSMTLLVLVFLPTIVTVVNTGYKIVSAMRNKDQLEDSQRMVIETDPNFQLTMFLLLAFIASWMPILIIKIWEYITPPDPDSDISFITFICTWVAIVGPSVKFVIYMLVNRSFRVSFFRCLRSCCCLGRRIVCYLKWALPGQAPDKIRVLCVCDTDAPAHGRDLATSTQPVKPPSYSNLNTSDEDFHCHDDVEAAPPATNLKARRILWLSVALCLFFMVCEVVGGFLANSLAIVTDAAHLATDFASMLISLFSLYIAARPPSRRMSFGFHRAEVLGAFFSVFLIWIVTGFLVYEAVNRIILGQHEVDSVIMAITAALGVLVNLIMGALLYSGGHTHSHSHGFGGHGHGHGGEDNNHSHVHEVDDLESEGSISTESSPNINVRAAFIHVLGDLIQSIGVLIAALIIFFFPHLTIVDPVCTLMFSVIVLGTTIYILRDAMVVLLEGKPSSIDFAKVFNSLEKLEGVKKVHDLRIWALTMDKVAVSAHLEVADPAVSQSVLKTARSMLRREFRVHECTVQIETYRDSDCGRCDMPTR